MRVERMPFTVYDVLGYLVPGSFVLWSLSILLKPTGADSFLINKQFMLFGDSSLSSATTAVIFLIASYAVGHLIGFLSSITVEKLAIYYTGYPSVYLTKGAVFKTGEVNFSELTVISNFLKSVRDHRKRVIFIHVILFPLLPVIWGLALTGWFSVLMGRLPYIVVQKLEERFRELTGNELSGEWFKYVNFYVINNFDNALSRMYNYITIYGFLRNVTFLCCVFFWFYFGKWIYYVSSSD